MQRSSLTRRVIEHYVHSLNSLKEGKVDLSFRCLPYFAVYVGVLPGPSFSLVSLHFSAVPTRDDMQQWWWREIPYHLQTPQWSTALHGSPSAPEISRLLEVALSTRELKWCFSYSVWTGIECCLCGPWKVCRLDTCMFLKSVFEHAKIEFWSLFPVLLSDDSLCVRIISSTRSGMGKSLCVKRMADRLGKQQPVSELNITIPVHGPIVTPDSVMEFLKEHMIDSTSTIIHFDIAPTVGL